MIRKVLCALACIATVGVGSPAAEDMQWVRVTVLLERGTGAAQQNAAPLFPGGIYSFEEVDRRGQDAVDKEILDRVGFLAAEVHDIEQSMRVTDLIARQYYLPLRVGKQAVVPIIDLNPRLGIVFTPQRFVGSRVVCKVQFLEPEGPSGEAEFTGDPITLTLKDADLKQVLMVFSQVTQFQIVVDPSVSGKVTVDLRDVPWDQALDLVLRTNGLGWAKDGDTLRVAPLSEMSLRKRVRTDATINIPRGAAGSATIASRGDAENRTVVLVVESVPGEPELVAERDGLLHPPSIGMTSKETFADSAMGDMLVFRGTATEDGDLKNVKVLASPLPGKLELFMEASRTWRPWTVLDKQARRIGAVVGYGLRISQVPSLEAIKITSVEHIGVEVAVGPPPPGKTETYPSHHIVSAKLRDLDSGAVIAAPRIPVRKGEEGTLYASIPEPGGGYSDFSMKVLIAEDGKHVSYSWSITSNSKVQSSHTAEFSL
jgi:hypothetical protein